MLNPIPNTDKKHNLCYYVNFTSQIQIARIANMANCNFEKVVFPQQRLMFEALPDAILEIHSTMNGTAILSNKICCALLFVEEEIGCPYPTVDIA